jgi:hypothetical protein
MGVDTNVRFTPGTTAEDVADVCSILLGHEPTLDSIGDRDQFYALRTKAQVENTIIPGMLQITVPGTETADGLWATYHINGGDAPWHRSTRTMHLIGWPMLKLRARPERIALAKRLVDVFGGSVDYNDCDDSYEDYCADGHPLKFPWNEDYEAWQGVMFMQAPLTDDEVRDCVEHAAYAYDKNWKRGG